VADALDQAARSIAVPVECLLAQLTVRGLVQVSKFGLDCGDDRALRARK
jgi:hypothetical protein